MNFFEHQERARRNTRVMLLLYGLAVLAIVLAVDVALGIAYRWVFGDFYGTGAPPALYLAGALGTLALILLVSLYHVLRLRQGGEAITRLVGARRVAPDTRDPLERRLLNVVEEMAIAAGARVPAVYVMSEERGINAFAAGHDLSSAVITVTRGALETLNRDELQGVVAHELSHLVNGDASLNLRMIGVLSGIVFIGAMGKFLLRGASSARGRGGSAAVGVLALGLALLVTGYVGLFFARLIKAAVSRQREFLADASSVQFTRNPAGIAGALDQIRASGSGTLIANRYAEDLSHMFFAQGVQMWLAGWLDTHPPVEERIRRVLPGFGALDYRKQRAAAGPGAVEPAAPAPSGLSRGKRAGDVAHAWGRTALESVALLGVLDAKNITQAHALVHQLSPALREAVHRAESAPAALVALMLASTPEVQAAQLAAARSAGAAELAERALTLARETCELGPEFRLPLVDLALPALKLLPEEKKQALLAALEAIIGADRRVTLHEFVVLTLLRSQLLPWATTSGHASISALRAEAFLLLALLAHAARGGGAGAEAQAEAAFRAGVRELGFTDTVPVPKEALSHAAAGQALQQLAGLAPLAKSELVAAAFAVIIADGKIRLAEAELMRLVGATLGCPVPPLIELVEPQAGQD